MSEYIEALQELAKQLKTFVDKRIKRAKFDRTVRGRIIELLPNDKYKVQIDGNNYTVKGKIGYSINDLVYVLIPQNNYKDMIIIF